MSQQIDSQAQVSTKQIIEPDCPPVTVVNAQAQTPILITCDHASNRVPKSMQNLGLADAELERHIAYDIGSLALAKLLAKKLAAPLIYSGYSRLVIDLNRHLSDPSCIPPISEQTEIPGNQNLDQSAKQLRIDELFVPYHQKFTEVLDNFQQQGVYPLILAIHTFTPVYKGFERPWHTGVMWDKDDRMARPFLKNLNERGDLVVGDNQPYTAIDPLGYAFDVHARGRGLPNLFLEVRQDLVTDDVGVMRWASIIQEAVEPLIDERLLYSTLERA